jgi:hypothetical protein
MHTKPTNRIGGRSDSIEYRSSAPMLVAKGRLSNGSRSDAIALGARQNRKTLVPAAATIVSKRSCQRTVVVSDTFIQRAFVRVFRPLEIERTAFHISLTVGKCHRSRSDLSNLKLLHRSEATILITQR